MTTPRVWHITGANTGFGLELALKALAEGDKVVAAVRTPAKAPDSLKRDDVKIIAFDLSWDQAALDAYAKEAVGAFGRIDALVNNAGFAYMGAIEEAEDAAIKQQFDINVFGILRTTKAFLPALRKQGSGIVINLSSVGGFHGFASNGIYCATKFAIEGITQALAAEIAPFGLSAVIVEPGYFRTEFLANPTSGANVAPAIADYEGTPAHEARAALSTYNGKQRGNPKEGAARIWEYVASEGLFKGKKKLLRLPLGTDCGGMLKGYITDLTETVELYEDVWSSTDFPEGQ